MAAGTVSNPVTVTVASVEPDERALRVVARNLRITARHLEWPVSEDERERIRRLLRRDADLLDAIADGRPHP